MRDLVETAVGQEHEKFPCSEWMEEWVVVGSKTARWLDRVVEICELLPLTFSVSW